MIHLLAQVFLALKVLNTESIISQGLNFESQLVIAMSVNFFWIESQPISQSLILKRISGDSNNRAICYIRYLRAVIWLWSFVKYLTRQWVYCRGTVLNVMDNSSARGIVKLTIAAAANNTKDVGEKATNGDWNSAIGRNQAPISIYVLFKRADGRIRAYNEVSARGPILWGNWHA